MPIERLWPQGVYVRSVPEYAGKLFAQVVTASGPRTSIHVSGTFAYDQNSELVGPGDMRLQVRQALANIGRCLQAVGAGPEHVVRTKIYALDLQAYVREGHAEWLAFFGAHLPASTTVAVAGLTDPRALVEIEAYAERD